MELYWQGKTKVFGETQKPVPVPLCPLLPTWTDLGVYLGIPGGSLVTNWLSSGVTDCLDIFCVKFFYYVIVFCLAF